MSSRGGKRAATRGSSTTAQMSFFCRFWIRNVITTVWAVITSHQPQCLFRPVLKFDLKRQLLLSSSSREARQWWLQRAKGAAGTWIIPYIGNASSSVHWYLLRLHSCNCTLIDSRARTIKISQTPAWPVCGENKLNPENGKSKWKTRHLLWLVYIVTQYVKDS